jgi:hypothetical protein
MKPAAAAASDRALRGLTTEKGNYIPFLIPFFSDVEFFTLFFMEIFCFLLLFYAANNLLIH